MKQLLSLALAFTTFSLAAQSPWSRSKAGFFVQASWQTIPTYNTLFGPEGKDIILERAVSERAVQCYAEYGLSRKTTLIGSLPYVFNRRGASNPESPFVYAREDSGSIAGIGNTSLALRHQFLSGKLALAGTLKAGFPALTRYKSPGLRTGYNALTILPMVNAGMGFEHLYWFAYGGYGYRSSGYSHFINAGAEIGLHFAQFWIVGFSDTVYPLENGSVTLPHQRVLTGLYVNDQGWVSIGFKAIWEINRFAGLNLSYAGAAWAQNVPKSPGISLGAYFKWE